MPKIEVNEALFFSLAGKHWKTRGELEDALCCAKAELDEDSDKSLPETERTLKIELNDTNRPDLWGTAGCARQLRIYYGGKRPFYPFFSMPGDMKDAKKRVIVETSVKNVRPWLAGFIVSGNELTDAGLRDLIQTQEKLSWNYGRKRRAISMGVYRSLLIKWPVHYKAVDPDSVSFIPLQWELCDSVTGDGAGAKTPLTLREILKKHPKGREYAFIQQNEPMHPLLVDARGDVLSYPPIINSADIGAAQVGDSELFVELTGTDAEAVTHAASIAACDLADQGWNIEPVEICYEYDAPFGRIVTTPFYFQEPVFCGLERIHKFLGEAIDGKTCVAALERMGCKAEKQKDIEAGSAEIVEGVRAWPPEYRNDYLNAADVMEDVMMGRGLETFSPERPRDFTVGRLSDVTLFSRKVKEILIGAGFQEMIYNYLGSKKDLISKMRGSGNRIIRISNPMTENYEYVRDSPLPSLAASESASANAPYPHKIFEIGKIVYKDASKNYGTATRQYAGILHAGADANFNTIAALIQNLFYYISRNYTVQETDDPRFIPGRAAAIVRNGIVAGVFGEFHPELLENWDIKVPCTAAEIDLDLFIHA
ncbi:MAG: phenylalanine--tRNA ligase subunit beta [Spirochaetaceae bacterium]|jgi:phenylalanyl-tRNA synthetase beta chain|nr:phenylalanine--tRNA ligase subunit beta [Spirochaetaceae bacterium]